MRSLLCSWLVMCALVLMSPLAHAEILQAPIGGRGFAFGQGRVACSAPPSGWTLEGAGRAIRPPTSTEALGRIVEMTLAASAADCAAGSVKVRLVATGKLPRVERSSVVWHVEEGRIEAEGTQLERSVLSWPVSGANPPQLSASTCAELGSVGRRESCAWPVAKTLPIGAASAISLWPRGAVAAEGAVLFDQEGDRVAPASLAINPRRVVVSSVLPGGASVDVSEGFGLLPLSHPEAVGEVECRGTSCRMEGQQLRVQAPPEGVSQVEVRITLAQGLQATKPGPLVSRISILRCPIEAVSGPVFRGTPSAKVILRLGAACARDADHLRFLHGGRQVDVIQKLEVQDSTYLVLAIGALELTSVNLTAIRSGAEGAVVAIAQLTTQEAPTPRSVLEIPGFPGVDFLPYNRDAAVHVSKIEGGELVVLPVDGVYSVERRGGATLVRGDRNAAGLVTFRFAFRATHLPGPLAEIDLARFLDPLQRAIKEANEPAPFGQSALGKKPLAELLCTLETGAIQRVVPGERTRFSFRMHDSCRLVLHRERLSPELGAQKVHIEIDVRRLDGVVRTEASVSERIVLRPGKVPRVAWIKGVLSPYDSVVVRVTLEGDETHYLGGEALLNQAPAVQWSLVFGKGRVRIYATTAIPTGLYRFGGAEGSGSMALNFGVISRMTWLDRDGKEGLLGLEAGVMAFGLTGSPSSAGQSLTQVGAVMGLGLSIPIANASQAAQASINLHGWFEQRITGSGPESSSPRAFIFGPSISIGNIGGTF